VVEALGPDSLNSADSRREGSMHELLQDLKFTNISAISGNESTRQAFALGRLGASHHPKDQIAQSHWVVFLDQTKNIWALYANDIDITDKYGQGNAYDISLDTAFGTDYNRKAILLGPLTELPLQKGVILPNVPQICALDRSTTFARFQENYKLTMSLAIIQRLFNVNTAFIDKPSYGWTSRSHNGHLLPQKYPRLLELLQRHRGD
jgi:hypothetical protein